MGKRKNEENDCAIREKIKKLEAKLNKKKCRRRIISSSSSEDETSDPVITDRRNTSMPFTETVLSSASDTPVASTSSTAAVNPPESQLDDAILQILGDPPKADVELGPNIHKNIADRWQEVLLRGLPKEVKEMLFKEHLIPGNCELLRPPILNPEVKAALSDALVKRDTLLAEKQRHIGVAIAALAQAMQLLIIKGDESKVLKAVSDACRMLCDLHFNETKIRRNFAIGATNANLKDTLVETKRDKYLFGENICDKLKSAKNIQKSGADLKQQHRNVKFNKAYFYKNKSLNTRALQRKTSGKPDAGRRRNVGTGMTTRAATTRTMTSSARPRSPPPQRRPPRRT